MRLRSDHLLKIVAALTPFVQPGEATLFLFGSRAKDHLKGGDIDLVLVLRSEPTFQSLIPIKHRILAALHDHLGDRKIDLRLALESTYLQDPFFQIIMPEAIEIHRW